MIALAALALAQAVVPSESHGVFFTGNALYEECLSQRVVCAGYVMAVSDTLQDTALTQRRPPTICLSGAIEAQQLVDVTVRYLRDHPEFRHASAASIVMIALQRAFPCPRVPAR